MQSIHDVNMHGTSLLDLMLSFNQPFSQHFPINQLTDSLTHVQALCLLCQLSGPSALRIQHTNTQARSQTHCIAHKQKHIFYLQTKSCTGHAPFGSNTGRPG